MKTGVRNIKHMHSIGYRIDPDIHLSEGLAVREALDSLPYEKTTIEHCSSKVFYGNIFSRIFVNKPDHGVHYLQASDTTLSDLNTGLYLSKKQADELSYLKFKKDWILITCSGTLGKVTYTNKIFEDFIGTHDLIRIIPNDVNVKKGVLYAFLSSKYGYYQITQSQFGGVVKHINVAQTESIIVPKFPEEFQMEVDAFVQESARLREEAADALAEAVAHFDSLYEIKDEKTKTFSKKVKDFSLGGLFAAYNNNLEVDEFIAQYENQSIAIKELTTRVFAPPLFKHIYLSSDNGYPFMTGSELTQFNLRYYRWLSPRGVKDINDYVVHEGDLLLYKSGTTDGGILGNVFIADKKLDGCCLSDHVIRMFFKEKRMAYWTFAFLRSKGAKEMLKRLATGSMIPFITPERLSQLKIPLPDNKFDGIVDLISSYISLNSESKQLEDKAIRMVESEIEKWAK